VRANELKKLHFARTAARLELANPYCVANLELVGSLADISPTPPGKPAGALRALRALCRQGTLLGVRNSPLLPVSLPYEALALAMVA